MKRLAAILVMLASFAAAFPGADLWPLLARYGEDVNPILAMEPLAWWRGDGNALDSSGNDYHGAWTGTEQYADWYTGQAFDFTALDGYVETAELGAWAPQTNRTMSLWFLQKNNDPPSREFMAVWGQSASPFVGIGFSRRLQANRYTGYRSLTGAAAAINIATTYPTNSWTHVIVMVGENNLHVRVDGSEYNVDTSAYPQVAPANTGFARRIGRYSAEATFNGYVAQVLLFDRLLSETEIAILANPESYK